MGETTAEDLTGRLLRHVERGERDAAVAMVRDLQDAGWAAERLVGDLIVPVQVEVGERWYRNEWTVAQEHAATGIMAAALARLELAAPTPTDSDRTLVLCCPEEESHAFPLTLIAHLLRRRGWCVHELGASTPAGAAAAFALTHQVFAVVMSCTLAAALPRAAELIDAAHRAGLQVAVGGAAFGADDARALAMGADAWGADVAATDAVLHRWYDQAATATASSDGGDLGPGTAAVHTANIEAAVPLFGDVTLSHLASRTENQSAALDAFAPALTLLIRTAVGAVVAEDPSVFLDQVDWTVGFAEHRSIPVTLVPEALAFLADWLIDLPATRALFLAGWEHLEERGILPDR